MNKDKANKHIRRKKAELKKGRVGREEERKGND
jgi:hypothetical protein